MRLIRIASLLLIMFLPTTAKAAYKAVSSTDLIENAKEMDGSTISYSGEVIGDTLHRGDYAFIHISDGVNVMSCFVPADQIKKIGLSGGYRSIGDSVQLSGTFHRSCPEHGGDMDIHATSIIVLEKGYTITDTPSTALLAAAGALFILALSGVVLVIRKKTVL